MSNSWSTKTLIDSYVFEGTSTLFKIINVGEVKPYRTGIELIDLLFTCGKPTTVAPLKIDIVNISNINQVNTWYYRPNMQDVTSIYFSADSSITVPYRSIIQIKWENPDEVTYRGSLRFLYRKQIELW